MLRVRTIQRHIFAILMLAVMVNNVLAIEHLFPAEAHDDDGHEHIAHCHVSPGTCAEQPVPSGPGQILFAEPLLPAFDLHVLEMSDTDVTVSGFAPKQQTPPPRA